MSSKSSRPKKVRRIDRSRLTLLRKRCMQKPYLSTRKLCQLIAQKDQIVISPSTAHHNLKELGLSTNIKKLRELEKLMEKYSHKVTQDQYNFLVKSNRSYLDKELLSGYNELILHLGYFAFRLEQDEILNIHLCINARTGFVLARQDTEIVPSIFKALLQSHLDKSGATDVVILIPNEKDLNRVKLPARQVLDDQKDLSFNCKILTIKEDVSICCGMFSRFKNSFKTILFRSPEIINLLKENPDKRDALLIYMNGKWNKAPLMGFPTFGKSPDILG